LLRPLVRYVRFRYMRESDFDVTGLKIVTTEMEQLLTCVRSPLKQRLHMFERRQRVDWAEKIEAMELQGAQALFSKKLNFMKFYTLKKYEHFYTHFVSEFVLLHILLAYGRDRNRNLALVYDNLAQVDEVFYYFIRRYRNFETVFNFFKEQLY
jgi:hypothetical protein